MLPETIVASDMPRNVLRRNVSQAAKKSVRERISIDWPYVTAEHSSNPNSVWGNTPTWVSGYSKLDAEIIKTQMLPLSLGALSGITELARAM